MSHISLPDNQPSIQLFSLTGEDLLGFLLSKVGCSLSVRFTVCLRSVCLKPSQTPGDSFYPLPHPEYRSLHSKDAGQKSKTGRCLLLVAVPGSLRVLITWSWQHPATQRLPWQRWSMYVCVAMANPSFSLFLKTPKSMQPIPQPSMHQASVNKMNKNDVRIVQQFLAM